MIARERACFPRQGTRWLTSMRWSSRAAPSPHRRAIPPQGSHNAYAPAASARRRPQFGNDTCRGVSRRGVRASTVIGQTSSHSSGCTSAARNWQAARTTRSRRRPAVPTRSRPAMRRSWTVIPRALALGSLNGTEGRPPRATSPDFRLRGLRPFAVFSTHTAACSQISAPRRAQHHIDRRTHPRRARRSSDRALRRRLPCDSSQRANRAGVTAACGRARQHAVGPDSTRNGSRQTRDALQCAAR